MWYYTSEEVMEEEYEECSWLRRFGSVVESLRQQITFQSGITRDSNGGESVGSTAPWSWVCRQLWQLLQSYPMGVTEGICLSELQMLWNSHCRGWHHDQSCIRVSVLQILQSHGVTTEAVLEAKASSPYDMPGTHIKLIQLAGGHESIEMFLHQKYYNHHDVLAQFRVRLTGCRLFQSSGDRSCKRGPRLLPTDNLVILLSKQDQGFFTEQFGSSLRCAVHTEQALSYGAPVRLRVQDVSSVEFIHSKDGGTNQRLSVLLADESGEEIRLVLWDEHLPLVNLFKRDDWLGIDKPYVVSSVDGLLCLEYGPATIVYCLPYIPSQAAVGDLSTITTVGLHSAVPCDEHGFLDYSAFPDRVCIADLRPAMLYVSLCVRISVISARKQFRLDSHHGDHFTVTAQDETGETEVDVFDESGQQYTHLWPGQCIIFGGMCTGQEQKSSLCWKSWSSNSYLCNASVLHGLHSSPVIRQLQPLGEAGYHGNSLCCATVARAEMVGSNPWLRRHAACRRRVEAHEEGFLWCSYCGEKDLCEQPARIFQLQRANSCTWYWSFSVRLLLKDSSCGVEVLPTDDCCQDLLQTTAPLFASLPFQQQVDVLDSASGQQLLFSLSKVNGQLQADAVCPLDPSQCTSEN